MLLVDTNVLVDVLQDDPHWANWSIGQLRAQASIHQLAINPIIYAEVSLSFSTLEGLDSAVSKLALEMREIPRPAPATGRGCPWLWPLLDGAVAYGRCLRRHRPSSLNPGWSSGRRPCGQWNLRSCAVMGLSLMLAKRRCM